MILAAKLIFEINNNNSIWCELNPSYIHYKLKKLKLLKKYILQSPYLISLTKNGDTYWNWHIDIHSWRCTKHSDRDMLPTFVDKFWVGDKVHGKCWIWESTCSCYDVFLCHIFCRQNSTTVHRTLTHWWEKSYFCLCF